MYARFLHNNFYNFIVIFWLGNGLKSSRIFFLRNVVVDKFDKNIRQIFKRILEFGAMSIKNLRTSL